MPEDEQPSGIGLAEAIRQVRSELEQAIIEGVNSLIAFIPGAIILEFEIGLVKSREAHGGLEFSVLSLGAKGARSSTATHRVTVNLTPVPRPTDEDDEPDEPDEAAIRAALAKLGGASLTVRHKREDWQDWKRYGLVGPENPQSPPV